MYVPWVWHMNEIRNHTWSIKKKPWYHHHQDNNRISGDVNTSSFLICFHNMIFLLLFRFVCYIKSSHDDTPIIIAKMIALLSVFYEDILFIIAIVIIFKNQDSFTTKKKPQKIVSTNHTWRQWTWLYFMVSSSNTPN